MRDKIILYIEKLFHNAPLNISNLEMKEEMKSDALAHFDDLVASGASEQEAYEKACAQLGDVSQLFEKEGDDFGESKAENKSESKVDDWQKSGSNGGQFGVDYSLGKTEDNGVKAEKQIENKAGACEKKLKSIKQARTVLRWLILPVILILCAKVISYGKAILMIMPIIIIIPCIFGIVDGILLLVYANVKEKLAKRATEEVAK